MVNKFVTLKFALLFLGRLGMGESQFAERVPQLLHHRSSFLGGYSLFATTPETNEDGVCPSYTQACPGSCCPDGCCPIGTYCFVVGDYCCPNDSDCSSFVDSAPSCANSTWIMYARPEGFGQSPYFCCEPDQIALVPNLCVPNNGTYAAASLAPTAIQLGGTSPSTATSSLGTSSAAKTTATSSTGLTTPKGSSTGTSTANTNNVPPTQSSSGTSSANPTVTPKSSGARSVLSGDWPQAVTILVVATVIGIRLVL